MTDLFPSVKGRLFRVSFTYLVDTITPDEAIREVLDGIAPAYSIVCRPDDDDD